MQKAAVMRANTERDKDMERSKDMEMNIEFLKDATLFCGMSEEEISDSLEFFRAYEHNFKKGAIILYAGDVTDKMGLVMQGSVTIESDDAWGNKTILSSVEAGQFFSETYSLLPDEPMLVNVVANEDCRILFLRVGSLRRLQNNTDRWMLRFISNLLSISIHKNLMLSSRSFHTAPKTIRGRVMSYLNSVSMQKHAREFNIPFDRQQLADYLNLERTALSKELGKMKKDGLIDYYKNTFKIIV